jgi:glycosyltransferase involved in cell wall biosynthesis
MSNRWVALTFTYIQIHYGQYKREQLFEAARRSRACAYLADDDHGPLALQEILLAGCPTVGVRTGASFVRAGVTGFWVERLPPGGRATSSEQDALLLTAYVDRIAQAMELNRYQVREYAVQEYSTDRITSAIVAKLDELRAIRIYPQQALESQVPLECR